ncbi:MAG TPA: rhodanese-like domain-containing protein [Kofleriaceae bacterium]|jgi:rhodanese-related sulfurtransferase|nr:rhodanese-like domain-containing protein [Kofleriaceae bacterium]
MITTITPAELAAMVAAAPGTLDIVDVRDPEEWITGHVPGARLIPLAELRSDPDAHLDRAKPVVFVCSKGVRSLQASKLADRFGYEPIYNLDGGTKGWASAGFELAHTALAA